MEKELAKIFATRISQATRTELVVIMYEIILADIQSAKENLKKNEINLFMKDIKHGQKFLNELMGTLNYQYEISYNLISLYIYVNKTLLNAMYQTALTPLLDGEAVLKILLEGFKEISKDDLTGPIMQNTGQIYAGLTYGKGILNETYVDPNQRNRGFMA